jgi:hypothetical protein
MSRPTVLHWLSTSTRVVVGAATAVAVVAAVGAGIALTWPSISAEPVSLTARPPAAERVLACDGPLLALGRTVEEAAGLSVAAAPSLIVGPAGADADSTTLTGPTDTAPTVVTAAPVGGVVAAVGAAESAAVESDDLRGYAASACRPPLAESWLVGGATTTGSGDLLLLGNPGAVPATVQVTVYGASGPEVSPGGTQRVIPPGRQVAVPLAGLLPSEQSPVVRVSSTGAPVTAALQSSIIRGLTPGGVDVVSPAAAPASRLVIPGVGVVGSDDGQGTRSLVRLLSPTADAEATVTLRDASGRVAGEPARVPLTAGVPSELELSGLAAGTYTALVEADVPVVAGAWSATGLGVGADFAWYAAAPAIAESATFAVAAGPGAALVLAGAGSDVDVTVTAPDGSTQEVSAIADGATSVALTTPGVYSLSAVAPVSASVAYTAAGAVAAYPVWGPDAAAPPIVVLP